ncbi:hypothetical protein KY284_005132 [Solanum tuberosum]|nr:hypothetical protein KY284_005132 [Solanum tuberosum]
MARVQMLKRFKELCLILFIVVQAIGNVGRVVWLLRKWSEGQWTTDIHADRLFLTCLRYLIHKSIANGIVKVYNHTDHEYCMRHLGENLRVNHHCGDYLYLYYNAEKAYYLEEFGNHFVEFKNKCLAAASVLEHDIGFEKWSKAHFPGNRYDVMTTNITESLNAMLIDEIEYHVASIFNSVAKRFGELFRERHAYILKSMGNQMVSAAEKLQEKI